MTMDARSSVHPIRGVARGLEGFIEAEVSDGQLDPSAPATMRFEFSVDQLKSGNSLYDAEMHRRVDSRRFPTIVGEAHEVQPGASDGTYHLRGDVTVHGVKRQVEGNVRVLMPDPTSLVVEGEREFDVRDFDMTPPSMLGLKVYPQVLVRLQIVAERDGKAT